MNATEIIAQAWDLQTKNVDGITMMYGWEDEEEMAYIIEAEKLNGNNLSVRRYGWEKYLALEKTPHKARFI